MEHILQFFAYSHLPAHLQEVSRPFSEMAHRIVDTLPRNPERTVALRKLLESKDAAVRALVAKETATGERPAPGGISSPGHLNQGAQNDRTTRSAPRPAFRAL